MEKLTWIRKPLRSSAIEAGAAAISNRNTTTITVVVYRRNAMRGRY
jgi:hypothetical protein